MQEKIACNEWLKTPQLRPNVELDVFVIMPNHMHGIIIINGPAVLHTRRGELNSPNNNDNTPNNDDTPNNDNADDGRGELNSPNNNDNTPNNNDNTPNNNDNTPNNNDADDRRGELNSPNNNDNTPNNDNNNDDNIKKGEFNSPLPHSPSQTIGAIVRGYKSSVTKQINILRNGGDTGAMHYAHPVIWQRNYYENIIRNQQSYQTISNYIINNPAKWNEDKFFMS